MFIMKGRFVLSPKANYSKNYSWPRGNVGRQFAGIAGRACGRVLTAILFEVVYEQPILVLKTPFDVICHFACV